MKRPTRILVPTDFSGVSDAARTYAAVLAEAFGATLHLLHVVPDPTAMGWGVDAAYLPQMLERIERDAREQLEKSLTSGERGKPQTHVAVETGAPAATIVAYAESHDIDLIVMGTHGRGTLERMWVGSVTQGVLHRAQCPVVTVREPRH